MYICIYRIATEEKRKSPDMRADAINFSKTISESYIQM
jgi:hypothetical protein